MFDPGDVVVLDFPGIIGTKRRPAVVLSTNLYQRNRPDVIVGLLTAQTKKATMRTDYVLQDWQNANLERPTAFRVFLVTRPASEMQPIGRLTKRDWAAIQKCCRHALDILPEAGDP